MPKKKVKVKENKAPKLGQTVIHQRPSSRDIAMSQIAVEDFFKLKGRDYNLKEIADSGLLLKSSGEAYEYTDSKVDLYIEISKDIANGKKVYFTHPDTKDKHEYSKEEGNKVSLVHKPVEKEFVDPYYKKAIMSDLRTIKDKIFATGLAAKDSESYALLHSALEEKMDELENSPFKEDFDKKFEELHAAGEKYRIDKIGQRSTKTRTARVDGAGELSDLCEAVKNAKYPHEMLKTSAERMRVQAAEKFVKSYAMKRSKLKNNPEAVSEAQQLLSDPAAFKAKVELAIKQPYFQTLYGGTDAKTMERLTAAVSASPSEVFRGIREESKKPVERRMQLENLRGAFPKRTDTYDKSVKISPEVAADFSKEVLKIKSDLDDLKRTHRTSSEFKQLDRELAIAKIRLSRGSTYIDFNRMAAVIGEAADTYFSFKMKDVDNERSHGRIAAALKLKYIADAMNKGTKPSESVPDKDAVNAEIISSKIVSHQANILMESNDIEEQITGKNLLSDPAAFRKASEDIVKSETFKDHYLSMSSEQLEAQSKNIRKTLSTDFAKKVAVPASKKMVGAKTVEKQEQKEAAEKRAFEL